MSSITERRRRMTALVVEKNEAAGEIEAIVLRELDLSVARARTAREALDWLVDRSGDVSVLVADADLCGGMDGITLARRASVLWPAMSVIVTAEDPTRLTDELPPNACYVAKPWHPLDIVAAAERAARADHSVRAVQL